MFNEKNSYSLENLALTDELNGSTTSDDEALNTEESDFPQHYESKSFASSFFLPLFIICIAIAITYWGYNFWILSSHSLLTDTNLTNQSKSNLSNNVEPNKTTNINNANNNSPQKTEFDLLKKLSDDSVPDNQQTKHHENNLNNNQSYNNLKTEKKLAINNFNYTTEENNITDEKFNLSENENSIEKKKFFTAIQLNKKSKQQRNENNKYFEEENTKKYSKNSLKSAKISITSDYQYLEDAKDLAIDEYNSVINIKNDASDHFNLGNHYARKKSWRLAQFHYFSAYRLMNNNPDIAYNLAISLEQLNLAENAIPYYRSALQLAKLNPYNFQRDIVEKRLDQLVTQKQNNINLTNELTKN